MMFMILDSVLKIVILLQWPDNPPEHQADNGEDEESGIRACTVFVFLGETPAATDAVNGDTRIFRMDMKLRMSPLCP